MFSLCILYLKMCHHRSHLLKRRMLLVYVSSVMIILSTHCLILCSVRSHVFFHSVILRMWEVGKALLLTHFKLCGVLHWGFQGVQNDLVSFILLNIVMKIPAHLSKNPRPGCSISWCSPFWGPSVPSQYGGLKEWEPQREMVSSEGVGVPQESKNWDLLGHGWKGQLRS